jgi:hypothetical protein
MKQGQRSDARPDEKRVAGQRRSELQKLREGLLLRRTKEIIKDQLPKKTDCVVLCRLTDLQVRTKSRVVPCTSSCISVLEHVPVHPAVYLYLNMYLDIQLYICT